MKLVELIYSSRMSAPLSMGGIVEILDVARPNNARFGVTGMLTFGAERFLQSIEGPPEVINGLYGNLMRDSRHGHLHIVGYREIAKRRFRDWSMGFYSDAADGSLARAGLDATAFDPEAMTLDQAVALLIDMATQLKFASAQGVTA
jgi:hypothetical protein